MAKFKLPDELDLHREPPGKPEDHDRFHGGEGLCRFRVNLGRGAGSRQASCPRPAPISSWSAGTLTRRRMSGKSSWRHYNVPVDIVIADFSDLGDVRRAADSSPERLPPD